MISGSECLLRTLVNEGAKYIFGYPGGQAIPIYDKLYDYKDRLNHILVRHEQGAVHAAEGYARVSGKTGVALVTSGPGATNTITGIADAMLDSTPVVVITGQVPSTLLGTDAFQEVDVIGTALPITKWAYQVRGAEEVAWAVSRAFYIASTGRPGPVLIDISKDAQTGLAEYNYKKVDSIRSYQPYPELNKNKLKAAADLINAAVKPFIIIGQGIVLGGAEKELMSLLEKADIPAASTMLGLSAMPSGYKYNKGMLGMHGNIAPNIKTNECDLLIAIGMRFDDRVTGDLNTYAKQAKIIHFDIDDSELDKNVKADVKILGNAKSSLRELLKLIKPAKHTKWIDSFKQHEKIEYDKVIKKEISPEKGSIRMGEVVRRVSEMTDNKAVLVTDVGQNQMMGVRYFKYSQTRSVVTSGGLGTMGFGIPAAIGAKLAAPKRTVCLFVGDGGFQMTMQELGTIMQEGLDIKMIILNNKFLGMVRQWQELFFDERYSYTDMQNPDFKTIARAYGFGSKEISDRKELDGAIKEMLNHKGTYVLIVNVEKCGMVYPMVPAGACIEKMIY